MNHFFIMLLLSLVFTIFNSGCSKEKVIKVETNPIIINRYNSNEDNLIYLKWKYSEKNKQKRKDESIRK